ncbi:hypothetical protein LX92_03463 [Maribacter polysiphoniae]|uniref:Uncharacterized protein n=1 Tax=Maribacter polysiphoniae TaxID=429344 RepID=A0A316DUE2_9FLAO|nr:hypothetical protein LX92_03463 [Maribacter polysiphoniae]
MIILNSLQKADFVKGIIIFSMKLIGFINSFKIIPKWCIVKSIENVSMNFYKKKRDLGVILLFYSLLHFIFTAHFV